MESKMDNITIAEKWPSKIFWEARLKMMREDLKGRLKPFTEIHLIDAATVAEVETKIKVMMKNNEDDSMEFSILSIKKSKTAVVY